jgi:hypothetical protein
VGFFLQGNKGENGNLPSSSTFKMNSIFAIISGLDVLKDSTGINSQYEIIIELLVLGLFF